MISWLRRCALFCFLAAAVAVAGVPAGAVEMPAGSRNFTPPSGVPDHFSNEAEPFLGRSATPHPAGRSHVSAASRSRKPLRHAAARRGRTATARRRAKTAHEHAALRRAALHRAALHRAALHRAALHRAAARHKAERHAATQRRTPARHRLAAHATKRRVEPHRRVAHAASRTAAHGKPRHTVARHRPAKTERRG